MIKEFSGNPAHWTKMQPGLRYLTHRVFSLMTLIEPVLNQYITEVARIVMNFLISSSWFDSPVPYESNQIELMGIFPTILVASACDILVQYWYSKPFAITEGLGSSLIHRPSPLQYANTEGESLEELITYNDVQ